MLENFAEIIKLICTTDNVVSHQSEKYEILFVTTWEGISNMF